MRVIKSISFLFVIPIIFTLIFIGCQPVEKQQPVEVETQPDIQNEEEVTPQPEPEPKQAVKILVDAAIPQSLSLMVIQASREAFDEVEKTEQEPEAHLTIKLGKPDQNSTPSLVFAPVADFFSLIDDISWKELIGFWGGGELQGMKLAITQQDLDVLASVLGQPQSENITVAPDDEILNLLREGGHFSIVPFDRIRKEYKVLSIDGVSVFDRDADMGSFPLCFGLQIQGEEKYAGMLSGVLDSYSLSNRDPEKMLTINMTGVTALVRGTANRMEKYGVLYPAREIVDILRDADITHISNEIPFVEGCTGARDSSLVFCSKPEYFELLEYVGMDVVELTGNHMNDYGHDWMNYTLDLYDQQGTPYFGGGRNLQDSYEPVIFEIGPNKIAFLGCNFWGPAYDWATEETPGSAPPNLEDFEQIIDQLEQQGYNVIFTFQYVETYNYFPTEQQVIDFGRMADAGAAIVSGSQSHHPMGVEIKEDRFINYGLGNLFFDQMRSLGMRQGIIAKHIFYENRHINTVLITTMLEDYSQPRPTTPEERAELLESVFRESIR